MKASGLWLSGRLGYNAGPDREERPTMSVTLYHNPRCSKSRQALELLRKRGIEPRIIEYLKMPPTAAELRALLKLLGMRPRDILRTKEAAFKEAGLDDAKKTDAAVIEAIVKDPILLERPIAVAGKKAVIGRPPENVLKIL
jgi:arsenate reductase